MCCGPPCAPVIATRALRDPRHSLRTLAGALVGLPAPRPVGLVPGSALPAVDSTGLPITKAEREQAYTRVWKRIIQTSGFQPQ